MGDILRPKLPAFF